jgi:alpha-beta hydrolase superfamily lysophospholipase
MLFIDNYLKWTIGGNFKKLVLIAGVLLMIFSSSNYAAALNPKTILRRDLVLDLGNGLSTNAQLTLPAAGSGPFPGVLLVPGGGATDMDEHYSAESSETGQPGGTFLQIAEYLSQRGFAVLRYNKRGVGVNGTLQNQTVFFDMTVDDLKRDAEKALQTLLSQPEVNPEDITVIGHSESSIIVPRVAVDNPKVKKIVLMGAAARSLYDIRYYKSIDLRVTLAEEILDKNHDGLLSVQEVLDELLTRSMALLTAGDLLERKDDVIKWKPQWDTNGDGFMSIEDEFKPFLVRLIEYMANGTYPGSKLVQSHAKWVNTVDMIDHVTAGILILQGEGDFSTPFTEALLLEQKLTQVGHSDHTLISYPGLGHFFYPTDGWNLSVGPMQDYVLHDLESWLKDPARNVPMLESNLLTAQKKLEEFSVMNSNLISESTSQAVFIKGLESRVNDLEIELSSSQNIMYIVIVIAIVAVILTLLRWRSYARI